MPPKGFKEPRPFVGWTASPIHWAGVVGAGLLGGGLAILILRIRAANDLLINSDVVGAGVGAFLTIIATLYIDYRRNKYKRREEAAPVFYALKEMTTIFDEVESGFPEDVDRSELRSWVWLRISDIDTVFDTLPFARRNFTDRNLDLYRTLEAIQKEYENRRAEFQNELRLMRDPNSSQAIVDIAYEKLMRFERTMSVIVKSALDEFEPR